MAKSEETRSWMNDFEWKTSRELVKTAPPVPSLIMAAYARGDIAYRTCLEKGFPGVAEEYARRMKDT